MPETMKRRSVHTDAELFTNVQAVDRTQFKRGRSTFTARAHDELSMNAKVRAFMDGDKMADMQKYAAEDARSRLLANNTRIMAERKFREKLICAVAVSMAAGMIIMTWMVAVVWHH